MMENEEHDPDEVERVEEVKLLSQDNVQFIFLLCGKMWMQFFFCAVMILTSGFIMTRIQWVLLDVVDSVNDKRVTNTVPVLMESRTFNTNFSATSFLNGSEIDAHREIDRDYDSFLMDEGTTYSLTIPLSAVSLDSVVNHTVGVSENITPPEAFTFLGVLMTMSLLAFLFLANPLISAAGHIGTAYSCKRFYRASVSQISRLVMCSAYPERVATIDSSQWTLLIVNVGAECKLFLTRVFVDILLSFSKAFGAALLLFQMEFRLSAYICIFFVLARKLNDNLCCRVNVFIKEEEEACAHLWGSMVTSHKMGATYVLYNSVDYFLGNLHNSARAVFNLRIFKTVMSTAVDELYQTVMLVVPLIMCLYDLNLKQQRKHAAALAAGTTEETSNDINMSASEFFFFFTILTNMTFWFTEVGVFTQRLNDNLPCIIRIQPLLRWITEVPQKGVPPLCEPIQGVTHSIGFPLGKGSVQDGSGDNKAANESDKWGDVSLEGGKEGEDGVITGGKNDYKVDNTHTHSSNDLPMMSAHDAVRHATENIVGKKFKIDALLFPVAKNEKDVKKTVATFTKWRASESVAKESKFSGITTFNDGPNGRIGIHKVLTIFPVLPTSVVYVTPRKATSLVIDASFFVPDWETESRCLTALYGPTGCGKTTSLRLLSRSLKPQTGVVTTHKNAILLDLEHSALLGSVAENILLEKISTPSADGRFLSEKEEKRYLDQKERLQTALTKAYCDDFITDPFNTFIENADKPPFSGGQMQRLQLARVFAHEKDCTLVLFDEPTTGLDDVSASVVLNSIKELRDLGKTVVVATHDPRVRAIADSVIYLSNETHALKRQFKLT